MKIQMPSAQSPQTSEFFTLAIGEPFPFAGQRDESGALLAVMASTSTAGIVLAFFSDPESYAGEAHQQQLFDLTVYVHFRPILIGAVESNGSLALVVEFVNETANEPLLQAAASLSTLHNPPLLMDAWRLGTGRSLLHLVSVDNTDGRITKLPREAEVDFSSWSGMIRRLSNRRARSARPV